MKTFIHHGDTKTLRKLVKKLRGSVSQWLTMGVE